jgi:glyoxylate reductase
VIEVAVTSPLPGRAEAMLAGRFGLRVHRGAARTGEDELAAFIGTAAGAVTLLANPVSRTVLERCRELRVVGNVAVGYDNIDVAAAAERGVWVTNTPDVLTEATADLSWGLLLAVTRRIAEGERLLRRGEWSGWALDFMLGSDLRGKQLGIVGLGRIGRAVAARAGAFGMRVAFTTLDSGSDTEGTAAAGWTKLSLDELLSSSDVVSLHVPLTPATHHLIDRCAILRMRRRAYLVNTSRGPVVDEAALAWALRERLIAGAALDVYEQEPRVHPDLLGLENVVLAPHLGSATVETRTAMADLAARNVLAVLSGSSPLTPVSG